MDYSNYTREQLSDLKAYLRQLIRNTNDEKMRQEYQQSIDKINEAMASQKHPFK